MSTTTTTGTREKALALLGQNVSPEHVALTLGVEPSRISQLLSEQEFKEEVIALKYKHLVSANERDGKYDKLEDVLIDKLEKSLGWVIKPMELVRILATINAAKRRGTSAPQAIATQNPVVSIIMPVALQQKFTLNLNNQVIQAGEQELVTIQSGTLMDQIQKKRAALGAPNDESLRTRIESPERSYQATSVAG